MSTELTKERINEFKKAIVDFFKEGNVEVKEWRFNVEKTKEEGCCLVDVAAKILIKPKKK